MTPVYTRWHAREQQLFRDRRVTIYTRLSTKAAVHSHPVVSFLWRNPLTSTHAPLFAHAHKIYIDPAIEFVSQFCTSVACTLRSN